jgi:hypothetical protein
MEFLEKNGTVYGVQVSALSLHGPVRFRFFYEIEQFFNSNALDQKRKNFEINANIPFFVCSPR